MWTYTRLANTRQMANSLSQCWAVYSQSVISVTLSKHTTSYSMTVFAKWMNIPRSCKTGNNRSIGGKTAKFIRQLSCIVAFIESSTFSAFCHCPEGRFQWSMEHLCCTALAYKPLLKHFMPVTPLLCLQTTGASPSSSPSVVFVTETHWRQRTNFAL